MSEQVPRCTSECPFFRALRDPWDQINTSLLIKEFRISYEELRRIHGEYGGVLNACALTPGYIQAITAECAVDHEKREAALANSNQRPADLIDILNGLQDL